MQAELGEREKDVCTRLHPSCLSFPALFYTVDRTGSGVPRIPSSVDDQSGFNFHLKTVFFSVVKHIETSSLKRKGI